MKTSPWGKNRFTFDDPALNLKAILPWRSLIMFPEHPAECRLLLVTEMHGNFGN
ncbi:hypothetical protein GA0061070_103258 [Kosakonia oryziphila]|uniref:Uncharacterized protein n=1 Tax=Kosakonia oryziphila TaxID=1005667 RepID=A0A1C4F8E0_9ENTR|nr:hypothetical protein GA0061070_103258 [Kosakonia oryziphila]